MEVSNNLQSETSCLGRTCLKWSQDGELTSLDLGLVLERLARVDRQLTIADRLTIPTQP